MGIKNYLSSVFAAGLVTLSGCGLNENSLYDLTPPKNTSVDYSKKSVIFIIDSSPSMDERVNGEVKMESAKRSLLKILKTYGDYNRAHNNLEAGLLCFGNEEVINPVPLMNFNEDALSSAVKDLQYGSGTPLGISLAEAKKQLQSRPTGKQCIITLTDGQSNIGRTPQDVLGSIRQIDSLASSTTEVYYVAFDTSEKPFEEVKKLGAKVYNPQNARELDKVLGENTALLLEEPEVLPATK